MDLNGKSRKELNDLLIKLASSMNEDDLKNPENFALASQLVSILDQKAEPLPQDMVDQLGKLQSTAERFRQAAMYMGAASPDKMERLKESMKAAGLLKSEFAQYKTGTRVNHPKLGPGTVRVNHGDGHLTVGFDSKDFTLADKGTKLHHTELSQKPQASTPVLPSMKKSEFSLDEVLAKAYPVNMNHSHIVMYPVSIRGQQADPYNPNLPKYHVTLKWLGEKGPEADGTENQVKDIVDRHGLGTPNIDDIRIKPHKFVTKTGDVHHVLLLDGAHPEMASAAKDLDYHNPSPYPFLPHITVSKELHDEVAEKGLTARDLDLKIHPLEYRIGEKPIMQYGKPQATEPYPAVPQESMKDIKKSVTSALQRFKALAKSDEAFKKMGVAQSGPNSTQGSYLNSYADRIKQQYERRASTHASEKAAIEQQLAALKGKRGGDVPLQRQTLKDKSTMLDRMLKYHQMGHDFTQRAIAARDSQDKPPMIRFSEGNTKLAQDGIVAFNLPAGHTCPNKGDCFGPCYALQGQYEMNPGLHNQMINNWASAERDDFVPRMINHIRENYYPGKKFRIHDSGDFYSQDYVNKWAEIAKAHPDKHFYAYTKSFKSLDMSPLEKLPNFNIIQSVGGTHDQHIDLNKPHARIFATDEDREKAGYVDGNISDIPAATGQTKIGLVIHGSRKKQFDAEKHAARLKDPNKKDEGEDLAASELAKANLDYHLDSIDIPADHKWDQVDMPIQTHLATGGQCPHCHDDVEKEKAQEAEEMLKSQLQPGMSYRDLMKNEEPKIKPGDSMTSKLKYDYAKDKAKQPPKKINGKKPLDAAFEKLDQKKDKK